MPVYEKLKSFPFRFSLSNEAQLLTYMKLPDAPKGLLINFNSTNIFKYGQKTFVNELFRDLQ
jgi:hypothetical protein